MPAFDECALCGKDVDSAWVFHSRDGSFLCREHGESVAGPTDRCLEDLESGLCGWEIASCPDEG